MVSKAGVRPVWLEVLVGLWWSFAVTRRHLPVFLPQVVMSTRHQFLKAHNSEKGGDAVR